MTVCPDCGYENIEGEEFCAVCEQPLVEVAGPQCSTEVERRLLLHPIRRLNPREPVLVAPNTPVGEVLRKLVDQHIGCAVVVSDHKVVGIFTERDVLLKLNVRAAELRDHPVSEFMTAKVETLELDDRIAFALHKMDVGGYRHIPILRDGRVIGIISVRRILNYIAGALGRETPAGQGNDAGNKAP